MRNTNSLEDEGNSIRMDRIMIVDHFQQGDGHDRPLRILLVGSGALFFSCRGNWEKNANVEFLREFLNSEFLLFVR